MTAVAFAVVVLAILAVAVLYGWRSSEERKDLMRRNEELADQLLRNRGESPVFRPGQTGPLRKTPGYYDGTLAPSQKEQAHK